jgi:SH3 domain-containing YSC84-like protein 1
VKFKIESNFDPSLLFLYNTETFGQFSQMHQFHLWELFIYGNQAEDSRKEEQTEINSPSTADSPQNLNLDDASDPQNNLRAEEDSLNQQPGKYFYYDPPLYEETGMWIPVSVPPMTGSGHEDWQRGFGSEGAYFPDEEFRWDPLEPNTQMTMWDVFTEMLVASRGKVSSLVSLDSLLGYHMSLVSTSVPLPTDALQEAWKEMAQTLTDAHYGYANGLLETEPVRWLPDSVSTTCMLCSSKFHPIMCSRHHCRFCGGLFCSDCSKGRSLLPPKFRATEPQRVCDVCCVRLEGIQPYLMGQVSRASQPLIHDLTDLSTLRSWLNFPWARTMEYEIYKAANSLRSYCKVHFSLGGLVSLVFFCLSTTY